MAITYESVPHRRRRQGIAGGRIAMAPFAPKTTPPTSFMVLYATSEAGKQRWEVYQDSSTGTAHIKRFGTTPGQWDCPDRDAAGWVGIQRNPNKWKKV